MEKLFEFIMRDIEEVFDKASKNIWPLLFTASAPALLFAPYILYRFPLSVLNFIALRVFLFLLFFFFAYFSYLSIKKIRITPSIFFSLIKTSNFNHSFAAVLITVAIYAALAFLFFLPEIVYAKSEAIKNAYVLLMVLRWTPAAAAVILAVFAPIFVFALYLVFEGDSFQGALSEARKICFRNKKKTYSLFLTILLLGLALNLLFVGQFITIQMILLFMFQAIYDFKEDELSRAHRPVYLSGAAQSEADEASFLAKPHKIDKDREEFSSEKVFDGENFHGQGSVTSAADSSIKTFAPQKKSKTFFVQKPQAVSGGTLKNVFKAAADNIRPEEKPDEPKAKPQPAFKPLFQSLDPAGKPLNRPKIDFSEGLSSHKEEYLSGFKEPAPKNLGAEAILSPSYIKSDKIVANDNSAFIKKITPKEEPPRQSKDSRVGNVSEYSSEKTTDAPTLAKEREEELSFLDILSGGSSDDTPVPENGAEAKDSLDILAGGLSKAEQEDSEEDILEIEIPMPQEETDELPLQNKSGRERPLSAEQSQRTKNSKLEFATNFKESEGVFTRKKNAKIDTSFGFSDYGSDKEGLSSGSQSLKNDSKKESKDKKI
jgi:hypothetical protein